jgi:hypothetical protein
VACGNPPTTLPIQMKNQEDIIKGLLSFIDLWKSLAQKDDMRLYASSHDDLIMNWKGFRDALKMPPPPPQSSLVHGFTYSKLR